MKLIKTSYNSGQQLTDLRTFFMKLITTSWDDGHPLDYRMAELLNKYNLAATFYIPRHNSERQVMSGSQIAGLAKQYEIGGHTLNHVRLHQQNRNIIKNEVAGSFNWLKDLLGHDPESFCFPGGIYNKPAIAAVFKSGYKLARTTELLCTKFSPAETIVSTTLQAYEHSGFTYCKHLLKRARWTNLIKWLTLNSSNNLVKLSEKYLNEVVKKDGCFHLWGHSWEIEENKLWKKLEEIFKALSNRPDFKYIENKHLPG